jgi:excinuclease UvrABC nuclease subunit
MKIDLDALRAQAMEDSFPIISAVYFLFAGDELVYIGQSLDVYMRVRHHYTAKDKEFDKWTFIEVRLHRLLSTERRLIQQFNPKYNLVHAKGRSKSFGIRKPRPAI